jgi:L-seryl-tRNA(Sec) selenium transferase (EC 2.9.1.1)
VVRSETAVGGGSLPGQTLATWALEISGRPSLADAAARLRSGDPPVVPRVEGDRLLLDPRTVLPEEDKALLERVASVLGG